VTPAQAKKWRKETQRTQEAVAELLGVTRGAYALWEQGRSTLGKPRLVALAALSGQKEQATLRQSVEGVRLATEAWCDEVERVIPKLVLVHEASIESIPVMPIKMPLATKETHLAALKIGDAYTKAAKKTLSTDEFVELHARLVCALL
jgi:transcriptional regulator with XRE-family HTH domain